MRVVEVLLRDSLIALMALGCLLVVVLRWDER